jgi:hypothetical protein
MSLDALIADKPFSYRETAGGDVQIAYKGKTVTTLRGREAAKFMARADAGDERDTQLAMARLTGHFKRGTERSSKNRRSGP